MSKDNLLKYYFRIAFVLFIAYLLLALFIEGPEAALRPYYLSVLTVLFVTAGTYVGTYSGISSKYRAIIGWSLIACGTCILAYSVLRYSNIL